MINICQTSLFVKVCDEILLLKKSEIKELITSKRLRLGNLSIQEYLTLSILYQFSQFKNLKGFYYSISKKDYPKLPGYARFILNTNKFYALVKYILENYLHDFQQELGFIDSTKLETSSIHHHGKVYNHDSKILAASSKGYSSTGEFRGFKFHALINSNGLLARFLITTAKTNDLAIIKNGFLSGVTGKIYADSGYVSREVFYDLQSENLYFIAKPKQSMMENNELGLGYLPDWKINFAKQYKKRISIERMFAYLKRHFCLNPSGFHSQKGFLNNLFSCLLAYQWKKLNILPTA